MVDNGPESTGATDNSGENGEQHASDPPQLRALVDTNVVLDLLLQREPWLTQARPMWEARDRGHLLAHLCASVLTDIFYICRKQVGIERAKQAIEVCLTGFIILPVDRALLEQAHALPGNDFEDNVQIVCAQTSALDLIVTRNLPDFRSASIPTTDPDAIVVYLPK